MTEQTNAVSEQRAHQQALCLLLEEFDRVCKVLQIPYVLFAGTLLGAVRHDGFIPWDDDLDVLMFRKDYEQLLREGDSVLNKERFFLQKEFSEHWPMFFSKLRLNGTTCLEKYHPKDENTHQGVYIDIFPCDHCRKTELGRRLQFLSSKVVIAKSLDQRGYDTNSKAKRLFMAACRCLPVKPFLRLAKSGQENSSHVHGFLAAAHGYHQSLFMRKWFDGEAYGNFEGGRYPIPGDYDALLKDLYGDYMSLPPEEERATKQHALMVDLEHSWEDYAHYRDDMKFEVYTRSIR